MNSIRISIEADEPQQEILISQFSDLEAEGFEQTEDRLIAYFGELHFQSYEVQAALKPYRFETTVVQEQNWNAVWESNFEPVAVDDFCFIRAEFHEPLAGVAHEIVITPKMSFGTGHHATTYMMVQQMRDLDFAGKKVFDFGTGTGILAILAEKLGAAGITAIDVDPWSIENAKENAERNGCTSINTSLSSRLPDDRFDIILANINRNVILDYLPHLKAILKNDSHILFSGLLSTDETDILEACRSQQLELLKKSERNNWIALLVKLRAAS